MHNILLIVPPVRVSQPPSRFPLGLGYVAAILEQLRFHVSVLDLNAMRPTPELERELIRVATHGIDMVATGGLVTSFKTIARIARHVKDLYPHVPLVVGGTITASIPGLLLNTGVIDILVSGEAEAILPPLMEALGEGKSLCSVPGICFIEHGHTIRTEAALRIEDLDDAPFPAYHLFPFDVYLHHTGSPRSADIIASRGCPFQCAFCFRNFGKKVVFRSVPSLMDEIRLLESEYGVQHIYIEDELFVLRTAYVEEFCEAIERMGKGLTWGACARADTVTPDLLKRMHAAGCTTLMMGIESFSDAILSEMKKGITRSQIDQACRWAREAGIQIAPGMIIGMPGETEETIQATVEGCIRHNIPIDKWDYAFATPYPGTSIFEYAKARGFINDVPAFINRLCDVGDTCDLTLNLTRFSSKRLVQLRDRAIHKVAARLGSKHACWHDRVRSGLALMKRVAYTVVRNIRKIAYSRETYSFRGVSGTHLSQSMTRADSVALFRQFVKMVEIEVFSYCNRTCWFCPNRIHDRKTKNQHMEDAIYEKILKDLQEVDFSGTVSFSRYNEPLADRIILLRLRQARERLPQATLHINTNGDYLHSHYLAELYENGLRSLNIQAYLSEQYSDEAARDRCLQIIARLGIPAAFAYQTPDEWLEYRIEYRDMNIRLYSRNFSRTGSNRGGTIDLNAPSPTRTAPCLVPFSDMYIDYNGCVVPCCNLRSDIDAHLPFVLADLNQDGTTLFSTFTSKAMVRLRRHLMRFGAKEGPCRCCSFEPVSSTLFNRMASWVLLKQHSHEAGEE